MSSLVSHPILPILGDYIYIGGGLITLVVIVLLVVLVLRRA
jgi:hypothetical protein